MNELRLVSPNGQSIRPLVEAALVLQEKAIPTGIFRTEERLRAFEAQHGMDSETFHERYQEGDLPETLETIEWIGEMRVLARLQQKLAAVRDIAFENN